MKWLLSILFLVLVIGCSDNPRDKGWEFFPNMVHSVSYQPYSVNGLTPDGKTMLSPPKGAIAKGAEPYPYANTDADRARAARELKNPLSRDAKTLASGKLVFERACLVCHGAEGKGDGPIIPKFPNPPSFTTKRVKDLTDGELYHVITVGVGQMPPHALQVLPQDRWALVHYVNELRGTKP